MLIAAKTCSKRIGAIAALSGVSVRTVHRIVAETEVATIDTEADRARRSSAVRPRRTPIGRF